MIGNIERSIYLRLKKINNLKIINRNIEIKKLNTFINQSKIGISWYTNNSSIKNQISTKILDYNILIFSYYVIILLLIFTRLKNI